VVFQSGFQSKLKVNNNQTVRSFTKAMQEILNTNVRIIEQKKKTKIL
jgi:hypothetical protein